MGCGAYWQQVGTVSDALRKLSLSGILPSDPITRALNQVRASLLAQVTRKFPRIPIGPLKLLTGSPERLRVYLDPESGWFVEQRASPEAFPTYRRITEEEAVGLLKPDPPPDLVHRLLQPVEPVDN